MTIASDAYPDTAPQLVVDLGGTLMVSGDGAPRSWTRMRYARTPGVGCVIDGCDAAGPAFAGRDGRRIYAVGQVE